MTQQKPSIPAEPVKATPEKADKHSNKKSALRSAVSTVLFLIAAPLLAFMLTTYVFQSFQVDGLSMERTLQNGDRLLVWKLPRTLARLTKNDYVPGRGEIIIFTRHEADTPSGDRQLVKRVIGLPGERVVVKNGKITVYNPQRPNGFDPDQGTEFSSTIVGPTELDVDITVKAGEVFVCGDNRNHSIDSRSFGTVKSHDIIGRTVFRILPANKLDHYL